MELENQSEEFKHIFILTFTKELIINSIADEFKRLKVQEKIEKEILKEKTKKIIKEYEKPLSLSPEKQLKAMTQFKPLPKPFIINKAAPRRLIIPQARFPQRLQYIKPTVSTMPFQIDLGKLDPFIKDPGVQIIECNGPDEKIIVKTPAEKPTNVTLTKEEIDKVIQKFSEVSKIPIQEGIFRVAVGNLLLSAIISGVIGSKFIIKKLRAMPQLMPR